MDLNVFVLFLKKYNQNDFLNYSDLCLKPKPVLNFLAVKYNIIHFLTNIILIDSKLFTRDLNLITLGNVGSSSGLLVV